MPLLAVLAASGALGLLLLPAGLVRRPLSPLVPVALAWVGACAGRVVLVGLLESAWFRHVEAYLIPAYLLFPAAAASPPAASPAGARLIR